MMLLRGSARILADSVRTSSQSIKPSDHAQTATAQQFRGFQPVGAVLPM
jgi:hypothetical protein